jgi:radical SAM protein with 4Fe4S-binding SPASM domain
VQTAAYGEFSGLVHQRYLGKRAPVEVSIEVTRRCPLECQHCYNNLSMADHEARARELTLEEHCGLLDELVAAGCLWILYTGGEIFARKDFLEIYTEAKKRGFLVTLFTNGTMITPKIADYLVEYRPFAIEITLYGATRETYEALTQIPGSYDRCMRGVHLLLERNLPLKLKTVPTTINQHEVYAMKKFAEDLGVEFKFDPLINPRVDCSQSPLAVRLSPEEVVSLEYVDAKRKGDYRRLVQEDLAATVSAKEGEGHRYFCGGGMSGCAVDPYGEMSICVISHQQGYGIRDGSFQEGWDGRLQEIRMQPRARKETICDRCRIQSLCGMCPANGELENGDPESPVEFLCQVAHLRAYALGVQVPEHGDCWCCEGGTHHDDLMASAARIAKQKTNPELWAPKSNLIPALNVVQSSGGGCSTGGCSSCAVSHS